MEQAKKRMIEGEAQYKLVKADNDKIEELLEFLKKTPENFKPLTDYYMGQWMEDYTDLMETDYHNDITNEDAIFDEIVRQDELMKEIILVCAQFINKK